MLDAISLGHPPKMYDEWNLFVPQNFPHPIDPRMAEGGRASLDRDSGCRLSARVPDNLTYIATLGKSYVEYRCLIPELPYVDLDRLH